MTVQPDLATAQAHLMSSSPQEAPWDFHDKPGLLWRRATHRFPAATYLHRSVARDERAFAQQALEATGRSVERRVAWLGVLMLAAFAAMLFLVASGRATTSIDLLTLVGLGGLIVVASIRLVVLLRRHERNHDHLVDRVRAYEARLLELRVERQRIA